MEWGTSDLWIVATGMLCTMACALIGNFLVLRQMSLMGDAISHAVLPGLVIAFLVTGSRAILPMFTGAVAAGTLTVLLTAWIQRHGGVERGAAMGIVFTTLFAAGLLLLKQTSGHLHLDVDCVLYGNILLVPQDILVETGNGLRIPRGFLTQGCVFLLNLVFIVLFFKELRISTFDPELATTLGFRASAIHQLLMILVALTAVAAFEAVGSILVIAMLVIPPACAHLLTDRLGIMVGISLLIAALCALLGHAGATLTNTQTSGMMAVAAALLFLLAALLAPRHGILARRRSRQAAPPREPH